MIRSMNRDRARSNRRWQIVCGALSLLTASLQAMGAEIGGKPEKGELKIAYVSPSAAFTPLFVASDAGIFTKYGLTVKSQLLGPSVGQKALIAEEIDILVDGNQLIPATLSSSRLKYFGAYMQRYAFQIWGIKEVTALEQLRGKTIAVSAARGAIDSSTREALKKKGLMPDKDVKFAYNAQVPAILTAILAGTVAAGTISAPLNLKAKEAGLNFLLDIGEMNIPGLQGAYGTTERFLHSHPNTLFQFTKAMAEGIVIAKKNRDIPIKAIGKFVKVEDPKMLGAAYDAYAPYLETSLALRDEVIRAELSYLDEKEFPKAKSASLREFYDNSFVESLDKSGFFTSIGYGQRK